MPGCCVKECKHGFDECKLVRFPKLETHAVIWQKLIRTSDPSYLRIPSHRICLCHFTSRQFERLMPHDVTKTLKKSAYPDKFGAGKVQLEAEIKKMTSQGPKIRSSVPSVPAVGVAYPCNVPSTSQTVGFLIPVQTIGGQIQLPAQNEESERRGQISVPVTIMSNAPLQSQNVSSIAPTQTVQQQPNTPVLPGPSSEAPIILAGLENAFSKNAPNRSRPLKESDFLPVFIKEEKLEVLDETEFLTENVEETEQMRNEEAESTDIVEQNDNMDVDEEEVDDSFNASSSKTFTPAKKSVKTRSTTKKSAKLRTIAKKSTKSSSPAKSTRSYFLRAKNLTQNTPSKIAPKILGGLKKALSKLKSPEPGASTTKIVQSLKVKELCRLCANPQSKDNDMIPIMGALGQQLQIQEKILQHLPIAFSAKENQLPMQVCTKCANDLNVCHELIVRCTLADEALNNLIMLEQQQLEPQIPCTETMVKEPAEAQEEVSDDHTYENDGASDSDTFNQTDKPGTSMETSPQPSKSSSLTTQNRKSKNEKTCPLVSCYFSADTLKILKNHIYKTHEKEMCTQCEKIFDTNNELVDHVKDTHTKFETCKNCGKKVLSIDFKKHLKLHSQPTRQIHECHICNKSGFRKKLDLEVHMSRHQTEKREECSVCGKKFFHIIDVKKHHRASHRDDLLIRCSDCNSTFKTKNAITAHMFMRHLMDWKYLCNLCGYQHRDIKELHSHIKENHNDAVTTASMIENLVTRTSDYKCETCNNAYPNAVCLKKHKYKCSPEMNAKKRRKIKISNKPRTTQKCQFCNDVFAGPQTLRRHLRIDHNITADMSDCDLKGIGTRTGDSYECNLCHKKLASKISLQIHFRFHTKEKIYKCTQCDESFYLEVLLEYHENQKHKFITPYHCSKCPKKYAGRHLFYRHMRSHTKPKVCQYCGKTFALGGQLRTHELIHTGVKPHVCKICNRGFTQKHEMESHQLAHLQEKKFKCSNCNYKSNKLQDIVKHIEQAYAPTDNVVVIKQDLSTLM